jgi:branched-chain amino acid transport system ATP-binding protein
MTIQENLEMGGFTIKDTAEIKNRINSVFEKFPMLREKRNDLAGNLSGGQQQLLEMSMALMQDPKLLLIDEPSLGLSPIMVEQTFETILKFRESGTTVLMVEQNAKKALSCSDYAFVLNLGKNWLDGSGEAVLNNKDVRASYLGM